MFPLFQFLREPEFKELSVTKLVLSVYYSEQISNGKLDSRESIAMQRGFVIPSALKSFGFYNDC